MGSSEVGFLKRELEASLVKIHSLEKENQELKQEMSRLKAQINALKAHDLERKSILWKKLHTTITDSANILPLPDQPPQNPKLIQTHQPSIVPNKSTASSPNNHDHDDNHNHNHNHNKLPPPPPPPPLPVGSSKTSVRRVPAVLEFYRSLMKRSENLSLVHKHGITNNGCVPATYSRDMIGEIENRSTYLTSIKSDVEKYGPVVDVVIREVQSAAFREIWEVEAFVKWVDGELSCLVDERAVLKHFPQWPEGKADALREAAFTYRDLKNLESQVLGSSFKHPLLTQSLSKMQALEDRLEASISKVERTREGTSRRYKDLQIPWQWLMDTGLVGKVKLSSLKLAREWMQRIAEELECNQSSRDAHLLLHAVRFAFRVHQFAGGFDTDTLHAFEKLKEVGTNCAQD